MAALVHISGPASLRPAASEQPQRKFGAILSEVKPQAPTGAPSATPAVRVQRPQTMSAPHGSRVHAGVQKAGRVIDQVNLAQARLDHILKVAQSGKTFTPAELLALQAQVAEASQQIDLAGKVVEKATSGVKQVLQTQV